MDKTYQRGDIGKNGVVLKITPAHWKKKGNLDENTISCWYKEENKWIKRRAQTIVPMNIKKFEVQMVFIWIKGFFSSAMLSELEATDYTQLAFTSSKSAIVTPE